MFICEKCRGVGCHEPGCPDYRPLGWGAAPTARRTPDATVAGTTRDEDSDV